MRRRHWRVGGLVIVGAALFGSAVTSVNAERSGRAVNPPEANVNQRTEVRPDLGPPQAGLTAGKEGYKVFHPGAIVSAPARLNTSTGDVTINSTRRGNTDAYGSNTIGGRHSSDSDLLEDQIRVDGALQKDGGPVVDDCIGSRTVSHATSCTNEVSTVNFGPGTYVGKSYHYFHKSGYVDTNLYTQDSTVGE